MKGHFMLEGFSCVIFSKEQRKTVYLSILGGELAESNGLKETEPFTTHPGSALIFPCTTWCSHKATVCPKQKRHRETIAHIHSFTQELQTLGPPELLSNERTEPNKSKTII